MDLQTMQKQIVDLFAKYTGQGTEPWDYVIASHDLQYQVGNLSKYILQLKNFRYRDNLSEATIKKNAADELADIMAEVLFIAHQLDINLEDAWNNMVKSDEDKISQRS